MPRNPLPGLAWRRRNWWPPRGDLSTNAVSSADLPDVEDARPDRAPPTLLKIYGDKNGFGWKHNQIVGAQIIVVPSTAAAVPIIGSQQAERIAEGASALTVSWTWTDWYKVLVAARGVPLP